jgi:transcription elongation GreA/GreB family factor
VPIETKRSLQADQFRALVGCEEIERLSCSTRRERHKLIDVRILGLHRDEHSPDPLHHGGHVWRNESLWLHDEARPLQHGVLPITAAGRAALEDELRHRIRVERPRLIQRIQQAIGDGPDLAENSEYHAASTDQEINEVRIAELEDKLARAEVIDVSKLSGDTIRFGAMVTLIDEDSGEKKVWQIVGEPEADASKGFQ